jgi:molybdate transport system ATP-binding protein
MTDGLSVSIHQKAPVPLTCTLECAPGELLALVGPSGSGKTTLLRCVAGLHRPRQGHIQCGADVWLDTERGINLPSQQRRVGMVFQSYALLPHLSARDNVALSLWRMPIGQRRELADEWLARLHLVGLGHRRPHQLSGGQQQRVALARALVRTIGEGANHAVLLLDEPFSAVDQVTRGKLQQELARLRRELELPIILVTHDLDEARMLADRMVQLHHGINLQSGTPEEVLQRPANTEVARLVGLTNLFQGRIGEHHANGMTCLEWLGQRLEVAHNPGYAPGDKVSWVIPPEGILLHRRERPSRGEAENPIAGVIEDYVALGPTVQVALRPDGCDKPLSFSLPSHVAQRNEIKLGATVRVTLLAVAIHLMPWEGAD